MILLITCEFESKLWKSFFKCSWFLLSIDLIQDRVQNISFFLRYGQILMGIKNKGYVVSNGPNLNRKYYKYGFSFFTDTWQGPYQFLLV